MYKPQRRRAAVPALLLALLLAFAASLAPATASAQTPPADCQGPASSTWLNVTVAGVRNGNGLVAVTLYADNRSKFLAKHGSLYTGRFDARQGVTQGCIFVPKAGVYALAAYHDEDGSRKFNRSAIGLPTEGFGFSNNPSTFAGIPAFSSVRLNVSRNNLSTRINLRYP